MSVVERTGSDRGFVDVHAHDDHVVLALRGEIDLEALPALDAAADDAVVDGVHVVVDLARVGFLDSSGIHWLTALAVQVRRRGGALVVREPTEAVRRVLEIAGVARALGLDARDR
jgi:anti-anti-sigma factor